jgi:hypothetical protein
MYSIVSCIIEGKIVVSPEKPATKDTEARVETTIEEIKDKVEHATVVDRFMESFTYDGVTKSDLEYLKHSSARDEANAVTHVRYGNESREEMLKVWRFLKPSLEEKNRLRYERMWKFGLGETAVLKK